MADGVQKTNKPTGSEHIPIRPDDIVTVTKMNHIVEVQHMAKMNGQAHIRKLNADEYLDIRTGEIKEFDRTENRGQSNNSLRQTFKKMRYLINTNFEGKANELHATLTYKENMRDTERLYKDFKRFMTRLKRKYADETTIDYISIVEPQERGAWHCHVLLRFNDLNKVYIPNKWRNDIPVDAPLYDLWEQGYVTIRTLKDIDNIGAYLSAYLADIELKDDMDFEALYTTIKEKREIVEKIVDGKEKKFIKGGRLHMYPPGMNLFRKSKGVEYPERKKMTFENAKKVVGFREPHYWKSHHVETEDFENDITFVQYNTKRKD